jgi:hypothetical protein
VKREGEGGWRRQDGRTEEEGGRREGEGGGSIVTYKRLAPSDRADV